MHVGKAGIGHCLSLSEFPVVLGDASVHAQVSKLTFTATGQSDVHLQIHVQDDSYWDNPWNPTEHCSSQHHSELPSIHSLITSVHEHRKKKDPVLSGNFFVRLCEHGLETHEDIGNYLVCMFIACEQVVMAQQVFERLVHQGEHAWTSLLQGFIEHGEAQTALQSFQKMQMSHSHPTMHTYVALVKACESLRDMEKGQELHTEVINRGYESEPFVNNSLLRMYARCGSVLDAQNVFDQMQVRDTIAWTTLMTAYVDSDRSEEALSCLEQVQAEGVVPDAVMFVSGLKACGSITDLDRGQKLHKEIIEEGFDMLPSAGNTLVDMYAKCGLVDEACELFNELPHKTLVSWTALICGFAENGLGEDAVNFLEQMQSEGMVPDRVLYVCGLKACCSLGSAPKGFGLHNEITLKGFELEHTIGNTLIGMYAKFGLFSEARAVFDQLTTRDVVSWTALIAGYAGHGDCEEVQNCLNQMQLEGCSPNVATYVCSLKAFSQSAEASKGGHETHAKFAEEGFASGLADIYSESGSSVDAQAVSHELSSQNEVSWSGLIAGFAEQGASEVALKCLEQMEDVGLSLNESTLVSQLKARGRSEVSDSGRKVHMDIVKKGFEEALTCGNALVDMYAKCGLLSAAQAVFDEMPNHDVVSWTALMAGYVDHGYTEEALVCFNNMRLDVSPDIMLWNTSILCYANKQVESEAAFNVHAEMQEQCLLPNTHSFVSILQACCKTAGLEMGRRIHARIHSLQRSSEDVLSTALIDMYGKCGSMGEAVQVFEAMSGPTPGIAQWNAVLTGYARHGESRLVFSTFGKMKEKGVEPDGLTFTSILFACSHGGLVREGQMYYEAMVKEYSIRPHTKHHSCIVDLLGRIGNLGEAVVMLDKLPMQADSVAWNTVLGACRNLGDVELSEQAFRTLVNAGQQDPTSFVTMANLYADVAI